MEATEGVPLYHAFDFAGSRYAYKHGERGKMPEGVPRPPWRGRKQRAARRLYRNKYGEMIRLAYSGRSGHLVQFTAYGEIGAVIELTGLLVHLFIKVLIGFVAMPLGPVQLSRIGIGP